MGTFLKKEKVGVIGTGNAGMRHLRLLGQLEEVETIAISKRQRDYERLKGASYCIIASDTACHVSDAFRGLEADCALLIEKPVATCVEEALPLLAEAKKKRQKMVIGCVLRFSESLNVFREWLSEIGSLHSVRIECQSYLPDWRPDRPYQQSYSARLSEGGVLRDLIHEIDYACWIFGWPNTVSARIKNIGILGIESEEMADLWWATPQGCFVSMTLDYLTRPPRRKMTACGSAGTLEWDGIENKVLWSRTKEETKIFYSKQSGDEMYLEQLRNFLGLPSRFHEPATLEEGLKALAICDKARIASENLQPNEIIYP